MKSRYVAELLRKGRQTIADKKKWTCNTEAAYANGRSCDATDKGAARFCALGAVRLHSQSYTPVVVDAAESILHAAAMELFDVGSVMSVNDGTYHRSANADERHMCVLFTYERAIEMVGG